MKDRCVIKSYAQINPHTRSLLRKFTQSVVVYYLSSYNIYIYNILGEQTQKAPSKLYYMPHSLFVLICFICYLYYKQY